LVDADMMDCIVDNDDKATDDGSDDKMKERKVACGVVSEGTEDGTIAEDVIDSASDDFGMTGEVANSIAD
jgi:hypothetical protein